MPLREGQRAGSAWRRKKGTVRLFGTKNGGQTKGADSLKTKDLRREQ